MCLSAQNTDGSESILRSQIVDDTHAYRQHLYVQVTEQNVQLHFAQDKVHATVT